MKVAFVPNSKGEYRIELITESPEERNLMIKLWAYGKIEAIGCEEWREFEASNPRNRGEW